MFDKIEFLYVEAKFRDKFNLDDAAMVRVPTTVITIDKTNPDKYITQGTTHVVKFIDPDAADAAADAAALAGGGAGAV